MTKAFTSYGYDDALALFGTRVASSQLVNPPVAQAERSIQPTLTFPASYRRRPSTAIQATDFFLGDHWQSGHGFIGQMPSALIPLRDQIIASIRAGFVSENVIQEVVETHTGGILGREPTWGFLNSVGKIAKGDQSFEATTGETLVKWWNDRKALRDLQNAVKTLVCEGKVVRRLFIPRKYKGTTISASDLASALNFIYFSYLTADVAGVFIDEDTQAEIGIFLFTETDSQGKVTANCAELSFLNDEGDTVCRVVRDKGKPTDYEPYPLGGHLLLYELDRTPLITEQVQSNQRALNLAHTMMMRNVNIAGSRERILTNAKPPIDVVGQDVRSRSQARTPGTHKVGPGAVNYVQGWPLYSDDGGKIVGYTDPNVTMVEPVVVTTFVETASSYRSAIYSQCHQRHVLIVDKADTSGRAREVARREFERSLKETKVLVDASGRWQLETTLRLAAFIISQVEKHKNLRADFNCLIDAGEPDPEKQKTVLMLRQPGGSKGQPLISDETARAWIGVEDPAAELALIEGEAKTKSPADNPELVGSSVPGQSVPGSKQNEEVVN